MIILVGASASGKSVVVNKMKEKYNFTKLITYTTRAMRVGEVNDVDYHFITKDEFIRKQEKDMFIESTLYNDNYYGTAFEDISVNKALIVEPSGANVYYEKLGSQVMIVFLDASEEHRKERMLGRGDKIEDINNRIKNDIICFDKKKLKHIDLIVKTDDLTIEEVTDLIISEYKKKVSL